MRKEQRRRLLQRAGQKGGKILAAQMSQQQRTRRARIAALARARNFALLSFEKAAKELLRTGRMLAAEMAAGQLPATRQNKFVRKLEALQRELARLLQPQRSHKR